MSNNNEFTLTCDCGCTKLAFEQDEVDNDFYILSYTSYHKGMSLWERIKFSFNIIRGKDYLLYDMVLQSKDVYNFKNWVLNL
jgi:hypothetical protein